MLTEPTVSPDHQNAPASLRDYLREAWKDLELEMQLRKEDLQRGYSDTRGTVKQAYKGTGRAVKDTLRTVQSDLGDQLQELKADLSVQKSLVKQDLNEFLEASQNWKSHVMNRHQPQQPHEEPHDSCPTDVDENSSENAREIRKQAFMEDIRAYEETLADHSFVAELNVLIQSKLTSCADLVEYYDQRPELREYTLTKEITRMKYILFTDKGQKLEEPEEIVDYANAHPDQHDILWRAANQSIFGDVITSLTCEIGLVRPQMNTATFVDDISVTIDMGRDAPHITAECFVNVTIPSWEGERLQLAGVLVSVFFCPMTSKIEARVLHISPSRALTDEELESAADNLSER